MNVQRSTFNPPMAEIKKTAWGKILPCETNKRGAQARPTRRMTNSKSRHRLSPDEYIRRCHPSRKKEEK